MGLSKGVPFELEMRLLTKNGGYRWHLSQYNSTFRASLEVDGFTLSSQAESTGQNSVTVVSGAK